MRRAADRGFNHRQALTEEWLRTRVLTRVSGVRFLPYQVRQMSREHLPVMLRREGRKGTARIAVDLVKVSARWRCLPFHYFRYGAYGRGMSAEAVRAFLPETVLFHRLLPHVNRDTVALDDKTSCKRILASAGIPQPELIASGDRRIGTTADGEAVSLTDVLNLARGSGRVVVKPARYSSGGSGVVIVRPGEDGFDLSTYAHQWGTWLVERHVPQHRDLVMLNPCAAEASCSSKTLPRTSSPLPAPWSPSPPPATTSTAFARSRGASASPLSYARMLKWLERAKTTVSKDVRVRSCRRSAP
ncbi:hypothetical protein HEP81_04338 [Streptomyces griseofuscus]|uniref:ATP-grasp domain-containing protein n=1 Tax=Streptomyces griseofuscus TaxID=146922 RepID=A0A7H1Q2T5_9ACTN|nr:hypothetical protein [Streptomyces griseofuscus]QNT94615.1 hypothetical protein HEP81_04338 [Streptomyces griseofuscus]